MAEMRRCHLPISLSFRVLRIIPVPRNIGERVFRSAKKRS